MLLSLVLCAPLLAAQTPSPARRVTLKTADGWRIAAWYRAPARGHAAAILIHGLGSSHGEWSAFDRRLWSMGFGTLAIDMRGHGESLSGPRGRTAYSAFSRGSGWLGGVQDIKAAAAFLQKEGISQSRMGLIGASIGANLAAQAAGGMRRLGWLVLLSPGMDYAGVRIPASLDCPTVVAAAPSDAYAYAEAQALSSAGRAVFFKASSGHGVNMFPDKAFLERLVAWIKKTSK